MTARKLRKLERRIARQFAEMADLGVRVDHMHSCPICLATAWERATGEDAPTTDFKDS